MEAIVFINFMVFKDQLITINGYLYMSCVDKEYQSGNIWGSEFSSHKIELRKMMSHFELLTRKCL